MSGQHNPRTKWFARNILPYENSLRGVIARWRLPLGLELEDVVQETYAKLACLPSVHHITSPRAYFLQVARSILLMHVRRAKLVSITVFDEIDTLDQEDDCPSPETQVSDRQQLELLGKAVAELPESQQSAIMLRFILEHSHNEIGAKLGMSENAVQKMLARSLKLLANKIGRGGNVGGRASKLMQHDDNRSEN